MGKLDGRIELDEVLIKARENTKNFISELEKEENGERIETIDGLQNNIVADRKNTDRKKKLFIDEIKNGLGQEIKSGKGVIIKKKTLGKKIGNFFTRLFKMF